MTSFDAIFNQALDHHQYETIEARVPTVSSRDQLARIPDDRILSAMARRIFSAGFRWSVVDAKWPGIEAAFDGFELARVAAYDAHSFDALRNDPRIIRHPGKITAILANAAALQAVAREHGTAARWIAHWPEDDVVGLWHALAQRFKMMGGASGPWFLRSIGRDTFLLTPDVLQSLRAHGYYSGKGTGKRDQRAIQDQFNTWRAETGRSYAALSTVLAAATGPRPPSAGRSRD